MAMRLLIATLLFVGHVTGESVYNFGTRVEGALFHFEFPHEECESGVFSDSGGDLFGNLNRNMDTTTCNGGLGISLENYFMAGKAQVTSDYNCTSFVAAMDGISNYTLEIWKQTGVNDDSSNPIANPIVTIGAEDDTQENTCSIGNHNTNNFQMYETQTVTDGKVGRFSPLSV